MQAHQTFKGVQSVRATIGEHHLPAGVVFALRTLVVLAIWGAIVVGLEQVWYRGFGFTVAESWALSVGLMTMIGMLIGLVTFAGRILESDL
jgi:hypothetical protein